MRDLYVLLNSLVNLDRNSLIANSLFRNRSRPTVSELRSSAHRFARAKRSDTVERAAPIERILSFLWRGGVADRHHALQIC